MPSRDEQRISDLVGTVYDAALDPSLWTTVLQQASEYLDAMGGIVAAYDLSLENQTFNAAWGYEEKYLATLAESLRVQPLMAMTFRLKPGEFGSVVDAMPLVEYYETRAHIEWAKPQGIIDAGQATLDRKPLALSVIGFSRHERNGLIDDVFRQRVRLLVPHFRRAFLVGKTIDLAKVEASALGETLDGLASAVFLVDSRGGLLHANRKGEDMLAAADVISAQNRMLVARQSDVRNRLSEAIATSAHGDAAMPDNSLAISLSANGETYSVHVLPLKSGRRAAAPAAVAVFIRKATVDFPQPIATLARQYDLTAGETRTLTALMAMGSARDAAMLLGVSDATVKTHLGRIFRKTGTSRQAALVKLVAGHSGPVA